MQRRRSRLWCAIVVQLQVVLAASGAAAIGAAPNLLLQPLEAAAYTGAPLVQNVSPTTTGSPSVAQYFGGREEALAIDPANASIVFSASELGGLYKSTDGGASWAHVDSLPMTQMRDVEFAPTDTNLLVVSGNADSHVSDQGGVWRSTDGGSTWSHVNDLCNPGNAYGLDIAPTGTPGNITIFVSTLCGLMVSTDSGAHWSPDYPGGACCHQFWDVKTTLVGGKIQVDSCGNQGFFRSSDAGGTWSPIDNTSPVNTGTNMNPPCSIAVAPGDPNTVFIASFRQNTVKPNCSSQLYETDNANAAPPTWTDMKPCGNDRNGRRPWVITHPSVASDSTKFEVYFGNDFRVLHQTCSYSSTPRCKVGTSDDSGNWPLYDGALPHNGSDPTDIAFDPTSPNGCPVLETGDGGVFKIKDCTSTPAYAASNTGLNALDALELAGSVYTSPAHTDVYFGTQDNGLYASTDGAATWRDVALWDIYGVLADHNGPGSRVLYRTCCGDGIGQANEDFSSNTGWSTQPPLPPGTAVQSNDFWTQFGGGDYAWMTPDSSMPANWTLYATTNNGSSWAQVGPSPLPGGPACCTGPGEVQSSGPSATPTFYLHLSVGGNNKVYKMTGPLNNTATLTDITGTLANPNFISADPADPNQLYAYDQGPQQMMHSTNGGGSWALDANLTNALTRGGLFSINGQATTVAFDPNSSAILAGTSDAGIFASLDEGASWVYVRGSDVIPRIPNFFFDERTLDIYAASSGRGVWKVNVAPQSHVAIGTPRFPTVDPQYVTSATPFTLSAVGHRAVASVSYRFYLQGSAAPAYTTAAGSSTTFMLTGVDGTYVVDTFSTDTAGSEETPSSLVIKLDNTAPVSILSVGLPRYPNVSPQFVTSATPLSLHATDAGSGVASVSYRTFPQGGVAPAYTTVSGSTAGFSLTGPDGNYEIDTFATDNLGNVEVTHVGILYLDNTPPVITITQPQPINYVHSATLILAYTVDDGAGSGVASFTPLMDGSPTVAGHGLADGQPIFLLLEMSLGTHTFTINAVDNLGNADSSSVIFNIIVTPQSIKDDVNELCSMGLITKDGTCKSLLAKLDAASDARDRGQCDTAANIYSAFIDEVNAQTGKAIDPAAAAALIGDAQYLIANCP